MINLHDIIENKLKEIGKDRKYLAQQLKTNYQTLSSKFNRNSFEFYEFCKISKLLNIDLNELRDYIDITTGNLGIVEQDTNYGAVIHINHDYYKSRNISIDNPNIALNCAIKIALQEICKYKKIDLTFSSTDIQKIKNAMFITVKCNKETYVIAFAEDSKAYNKVNFAENLYINHNLIQYSSLE